MVASTGRSACCAATGAGAERACGRRVAAGSVGGAACGYHSGELPVMQLLVVQQ